MGAKSCLSFGVWNLILCGVLVSSHVRLVFPPARKYDLDFLTSHPPCGVPKGDTRTSLLSGSTFNITWDMPYPHLGGYRLELLDPSERVLLNLTPPAQSIDKDPLSIQHPLHLPSDLYCKDCTIRIVWDVREKGFEVFSCADVDITPRPEYHEDCMGHGRNVVGRCRCNPGFHGTRCEFQDECEEDKDCGVQGRCIDTQQNGYPRKQCYCQLGFFGPRCAKQSGYKSTTIEYSLYQHRELSPDYSLYWRLIRDKTELEIVLVANSTTWLGIGWKPTGINETCRSFPQMVEVPRNASAAVPPRLPAEPTVLQEPNSNAETAVNSEEIPETPAPKKMNPLESLKARLQSRVTSTSTSTSTTSDATPVPEEPVSETEVNTEPVPLPEVNNKGSAQPIDLPDLVDGSILLAPIPYKPRPKRETEGSSDTQGHAPFAISKLEGSDGWIPILDGQPSPIQPVLSATPNVPLEFPQTISSTQLPNVPETTPQTVSSTSTTEPEKVPVPEAVPSPVIPSKDWAPTGPMHPMDCADMVIGMAKGNLGRVGDHYTRDKSTPRSDAFYGGKDDLLGAAAFEIDGKTVVIFRRKVDTGDVTDHAIVNEPMTLLWAKGQEPGQVSHSTPSAVDGDHKAASNFYTADIVKYHGSNNQRGRQTINFFERNETKQVAPVVQEETGGSGKKPSSSKTKEWESPLCGGEWKFPYSCTPWNNDCSYYAKWDYLGEKTDEVHFTITVNYTNHWIGIGFSDSTEMPQTDAIVGWVESSGRVWAGDMFAVGYNVLLDDSQDISNITGTQSNGRTTLSFNRKRVTKDPKDMQFLEDRCYYFKFPVSGGTYHRVSKKVGKHFSTPLWSDNRICIRACPKDAPPSSLDPSQPGLTFRKPVREKLTFNAEIKLVGVAKNFEIPLVGTPEFNDLADRLVPDLDKAMVDAPGFEEVQVKYFTSDPSGHLVANMELRFDLQDFEEAPLSLLPPPTDVGDGVDISEEERPATMNPDMSLEEMPREFENREELVHHLLEQALASGRLGNIPVDPSYLVVEPLQVRSAFKVAENDNYGPSSLWTTTNGRTTLYCVIGCLIALLVVAVMQATITIIKSRPRASSIQKEQLIGSPLWNDYPMMGQTNYAYDTFSTSNNMKLPPRETRAKRTTETQDPQRVPNGSMRELRYSNYASSRPDYYSNGVRSLNRNQTPSSSARQGPGAKHFPTYSLPRTNQPLSVRGPPPSYRSSMGTLPIMAAQPDFYFMPSQRRSFAAEELPEKETISNNRHHRS